MPARRLSKAITARFSLMAAGSSCYVACRWGLRCLTRAHIENCLGGSHEKLHALHLGASRHQVQVLIGHDDGQMRLHAKARLVVGRHTLC